MGKYTTTEFDNNVYLEAIMNETQNKLTVAIAAIDRITEHLEDETTDSEDITLAYGVYAILRDCRKELEAGRLGQPTDTAPDSED